ncbi:oxygenase MpaB family protein [Catenulispora rubra]|uniref:oxygenase MpaB family protein n=1 Tax=Catenulispora rubra TaxID=280293 RepID=UPI001E3CEAE2|nr:oxygenase MpaB family protein [Catenulispora rubra]
MSTNAEALPELDKIVTEERLLGTERRWRRFGEPIPAGKSMKDDGTPDYGIFAPGSIIWEVLLHPATIVFETVAQATLQMLYKPIAAGIRDEDPISRKARAGTYTIFDAFDRAQRNSGMHAPMWLGDTATATRMAGHLHNIHQHVKGDIIDVGSPELGGYAASEPRDAMWAAITELHAILWMYERFAYHGDDGPRPLTDAQRDQYVREMAPYLRLVGAREDEIPKSMAELDALYDTYWDLFGRSDTINVFPKTGEDMHETTAKCIERNWHPTQHLAADVLMEVFQQFSTQILATFPKCLQIKAGLDESQRAAAAQALEDSRDLIRESQQPENDRRMMRMMWGPDGVTLIDSARELHRQVLRERGSDEAS